MAGTEPRPAGVASQPAIRCAECNELVPADRVRHREERIKIGPGLGQWRIGGPPIFSTPPGAAPGLELAADHAFNARNSYRIERIPICVDCLRRQRLGLVGVCGVAALCVIAALFIYSRDETPPGTRVTLSEQQSFDPATPPPSTALARPPSAPSSVAVNLPAPVPAPAPTASIAPQPPADKAVSAFVPVPAAAAPSAASDAAAPRPNDKATETAAFVPPPSSPPAHKPAARKPATQRPSAAPSALALRNDGYTELLRHRYAEAIATFQEAAAMGDAYAPMYIGQIFENGLGVARNVGQASYWYGIAINRGNGAALSALNHLRMNPY